MALRWTIPLFIVGLAACDHASGLSDFEIATGGQGGVSSEGGGAGSGGSAGAGSGGHPDCLVQPTESVTTTIVWNPVPMTTLAAPVFQVTDQATPFTYVSLRLCTPTGLRVIERVDLAQCTEDAPPCTWTFSTTPLPAGNTQVAFAIMSNTVIVETADMPVFE